MTNRRILGRVVTLIGIILVVHNLMNPPTNIVTMIAGGLLFALGLFIRLQSPRPG